MDAISSTPPSFFRLRAIITALQATHTRVTHDARFTQHGCTYTHDNNGKHRT
jgi:hypothetical protein